MLLELHEGSIDCSEGLASEFPPIEWTDIGDRKVVVYIEREDGKDTIVPFTTHIGSGAAICYEALLSGKVCASMPAPGVRATVMLVEAKTVEHIKRIGGIVVSPYQNP